MSTPSLFKLKEEFQNQDFCLSHFSCLINLSHVTPGGVGYPNPWNTGESIPAQPPYSPDFMARYVESLK